MLRERAGAARCYRPHHVPCGCYRAWRSRSIMAGKLNYPPLEITTRDETVILFVDKIAIRSGNSCVVGRFVKEEEGISTHQRTFWASSIIRIHNLNSNEASEDADKFLRNLRSRLSAERKHRASLSAAPTLGQGQAAPISAPKVGRRRATSPCYSCGRSILREELVRQRVLRGNRGRRHAGSVLMCRECAAQQRSENMIVFIMGLLFVVLVMLVLAALGIPLDKPLFKNGVWVGG